MKHDMKHDMKHIINHMTSSINAIALVLATVMLLMPMGATAQTMRGDFDMDGQVNMGDLSRLIDYLLFDYVGEQSAADFDTITVGDQSFVMVRVEGGVYSKEYGKSIPVETFSIGQTEVTMGLWKAIMGSTPTGIYVPGPDYPVCYVSWNECQEFIASLNELTGLTFRLPSTTEWEYAAKGGRLTRVYKYSGGNDIDQVAWYKDNSDSDVFLYDTYFHQVATKAPNELGLYDMSGNVEEWCNDFLGFVGEYAVTRGGSYMSNAENCEIEKTVRYAVGNKVPNGGLRLAL